LKKLQKKCKELIVLCGTSHCGKSTYAAKLRGYNVINSDTIRYNLTGSNGLGSSDGKVWDLFNRLKLECIEKGENIVLDACHITPQARWHALQNADGYKTICVLFDVKLNTVKSRCKEKWATEMWRTFSKTKPTKSDLLDEGFDEVIIVSGEKGGVEG